MNDLQPGDLLVTYGMGWWKFKRVKHISLVVSVYGQPCVYESTLDPRPLCIRTGRQEPKGVQAHYVDDIEAAGETYRLPLIRPLYFDEEDRILAVAESCLGRGYEYIGGKTSSAFVARVLSEVGVLNHPNLRQFSPARLASFAISTGIYGKATPII